MKKLILVFVMLFCIGSFLFANELTDYVNKSDSSFTYKLDSVVKNSNASTFVVNMTSQTWQSVPLTHTVLIIYPNAPVIKDTAVLLNTGGGYSKNDIWTTIGATIAKMVSCPVVIVFDIPNQPMWGKTEDALVSYTFKEAFTTKNYTEWPLLFTMAKAVSKTMDITEAISKEQLGIDINKFIVTGASKRGWTTWMAAATGDKRIVGMMPIVFDFLDMKSQIKHQRDYYGDLSIKIGDYTSLKFDEVIYTKEGAKLAEIVDPYYYIKNIKIPKLIINGTNDPYWTLDSSSLYFNKLKGDKYLWYSVNGGHDLGILSAVDNPMNLIVKINPLIGVMKNFIYKVALGKDMEDFKWSWKQKGKDVQCVLNVDPKKVAEVNYYLADNSKNRDFRSAVWEPKKLEPKNGKYIFIAKALDNGYRASYIEVKFKNNETGNYSLFTTPYVFK